MKPFNAFSIHLTQYIIQNHPDRILEKEFIQDRGVAAAATFAECSRQGMNYEEAMSEANAVLYRGLIFSPYGMVNEIIDRDFPEVNNLGVHRESLLMQMLAYVKPVLAQYHNEGNDAEFQGSALYPTAYRHITRMINQYVHDHGIQ